MGLSSNLMKVLDQRLSQLGLERVFRVPNTGRSFRVQRSLFKDTGMTGEDKVQWIFIVPHVLGHRALCLPEQLRDPVLEAFAIAQTLVIASRGFRAYTKSELHYIFDRGFVTLFSCMERIHHINHDKKLAKKWAKYRKNPRKHKLPTAFRRETK